MNNINSPMIAKIEIKIKYGHPSKQEHFMHKIMQATYYPMAGRSVMIYEKISS